MSRDARRTFADAVNLSGKPECERPESNSSTPETSTVCCSPIARFSILSWDLASIGDPDTRSPDRDTVCEAVWWWVREVEALGVSSSLDAASS